MLLGLAVVLGAFDGVLALAVYALPPWREACPGCSASYVPRVVSGRSARPAQRDLRQLTFLFAAVLMPLAGGFVPAVLEASSPRLS